MNTALAKKLPLPVSPPDSYDSPHSKAHLLLQAHFSHSDLPIADYQTDTKSVLDQALRILQVCVYTVRVYIYNYIAENLSEVMQISTFLAIPCNL